MKEQLTVTGKGKMWWLRRTHWNKVYMLSSTPGKPAPEVPKVRFVYGLCLCLHEFTCDYTRRDESGADLRHSADSLLGNYSDCYAGTVCLQCGKVLSEKQTY